MTYHNVQTPILIHDPNLRQRALNNETMPLRRRIEIEVIEEKLYDGPVWTYPGGGSSHYVTAPPEEIQVIKDKMAQEKHLLGEWLSTAICGNDILSSVLYSSGLVALKAGALTPIPLLMVSIVLYFFRFIYEEVVTAIPLNGGSYNVLLNTTSKRVAAFGAALGILSYLATGVVSGASAANYLGTQVELPIVLTTVGLLFFFALLNIIGIGESAIVALAIFTFHTVTLSVLAITGFVYMVQHTSIFQENIHTSLPQVDFAGKMIEGNVAVAIFFGFSTALLGITGFESSAQFVEEQEPGVFRKTLRNMWAFVTVFNTVLSIICLGVLPLEGDNGIYAKKDVVLAEMGRVAGGKWLELWVSIDAFIVLSGAVLTSYVGITGLVRRLAYDRVLPAFLMKTNKWRHTNHSIILLYFVVASSIVIIFDADTEILAGVYTYSFLGLMALFAFGCMVLKAKRSEIPRDVHASWWTCILGFVLVVIGIFGNLLGDPIVLTYFLLYLSVVAFVMFVMLERVMILHVVLAVMKKLFPSKSLEKKEAVEEQVFMPLDAQEPALTMIRDKLYSHTGAVGGRTITKAILDINDIPIVFFLKHADLNILNKAILYVRRNEQTHTLRIVHVSNPEEGEDEVKKFEDIVKLFDHVYPKIRIDYVSVKGEFDPPTVKWISQSMKCPTNMMFITQPGDDHVHQVSKLGVRVITA
jgi:amino acid transporter